ncbi:MAG: class I SAM-dependent methyltransferase [bacterium]|nr:class I SAM-dependent methyltransferase [bacterium]
MSSTRKLYDEWSATYDAVANPTRDLEKRACESLLGQHSFERVLELGGGTGKNTGWLAERSREVVSVDLSSEMQAVAREKVTAANVEFRIGDVTDVWNFGNVFDLITCSLRLEHVEDLVHVFREAAGVLVRGGRIYVCELHPFKQYGGSKARFEAGGVEKILECFTHHLSDYINAALISGFAIERIDEWFDGYDRSSTPRLVSFVFKK